MYILPSDFWMLYNIPSLRSLGTLRLLNFIKLVSNEIDEYCNTRFLPTHDSYSLDPSDSFFTRRRPLLDVSVLSLDGSPLAPGSDFFAFPDSSKIVIPNLPDSAASLSIDYTFGYSHIPATVKQVAADLIKLLVDSADSPLNGFISESWDNEYSYNRGSSFDLSTLGTRKHILSRLDHFVVPSAAPSSPNPSPSSHFVKAWLL